MNPKNDWKFIQEQVHKEKPSQKNATKREVLFYLQLLLSRTLEKNVKVDFFKGLYNQTKEFYLNYEPFPQAS